MFIQYIPIKLWFRVHGLSHSDFSFEPNSLQKPLQFHRNCKYLLLLFFLPGLQVAIREYYSVPLAADWLLVCNLSQADGTSIPSSQVALIQLTVSSVLSFGLKARRCHKNTVHLLRLYLTQYFIKLRKCGRHSTFRI